jgi:hypothetical protein
MSSYVSNGHELFLKWHEQLGPYVRIRLLHRHIVLVADPATAIDIYGRGSNSCPQRTPEYTAFDKVGWQQGAAGPHFRTWSLSSVLEVGWSHMCWPMFHAANNSNDEGAGDNDDVPHPA